MNKEEINNLKALFRDYIKILRAINKTNQKAEVFDLEMSLSILEDEILIQMKGGIKE